MLWITADAQLVLFVRSADPVVRALQQKGVSQDDMPRYVRQNMHVSDPDTGDQYQLVPDSNPEGRASTDSSTILIGEEFA